MRVEGPVGGFSDTPGKERVGDKRRAPTSVKGPGARPPTFVEELQGALAEDASEDVDVEQLLADIDSSGKELTAKPTAERLKAYKESVKRFMLVAVRKTFRVQVVEGRGIHPKLYVMVEKIESRLDELARQVLTANRNPLRLLAQLEELRGLLLDLKT
ncbi:MAG: YaaR family protein [bacterium]